MTRMQKKATHNDNFLMCCFHAVQVWSITYHSWLTFVLLLWACLIWMLRARYLSCSLIDYLLNGTVFFIVAFDCITWYLNIWLGFGLVKLNRYIFSSTVTHAAADSLLCRFADGTPPPCALPSSCSMAWLCAVCSTSGPWSCSPSCPPLWAPWASDNWD